MELNDLVDARGKLTPRGELAAFEGMAGNKGYATHVRLEMAMQVIEGLRRYLDLAEMKLARVQDVYAEHEDCGGGCIGSIFLEELGDALNGTE